MLRTDYTSGKFLANPPEGEEIVIAGLSASFPNAENVNELKDALFNKHDLMCETEQRFQILHPDVPKRMALLNNVDKFDAGFFGVHYRQAHTLDPGLRILLEKTIEAILDAGLHPSDLEGSRTGVFLANSNPKVDVENLEQQQYYLTGRMRSVMANRISYFFKLNGPSFAIDSGSNTSLIALRDAFFSLRTGVCDNAIVAGTHIHLEYQSILGYTRLGPLSSTGWCRPFDASANGYVKGDCVGALLLQKAGNAKRNYAQIIHVKSNSDGFKVKGMTFPSREQLALLIKEFYEECEVDPPSLTYFEAHGTGTIAGDPEEEAAIDQVIGKHRNQPLLIGSVKSTIGHSEAAAGITSIVKCIIALESGFIPPTLNFSKPRPGFKGIEENRLQVVTEKLKIMDEKALIGINGMGFGGVNSHTALRWNVKEKKNNGIPEDDLPRLVCVSGRTEEAVTHLLNDFNSRSLDAEYASLLHEIFRKDIPGHYYRGFSITSKNEKIKNSFTYFTEVKRPLQLVFTNFGITWKEVAKQLIVIPMFSKSFKKTNNILFVKNIDLLKHIQTDTKHNSKVVNIIGGIAVHIGIIDVLRDLGIHIEGVFGQNLEKIVCAFFEGSLTLEKTVLLTYQIAIQFIEKNLYLDNEPSTLFASLNDHLKSSEIFKKAISLNTNLNTFVKNITSESIVLEIGFVNLLTSSVLAKHVKTINFALEKNKTYFIGFLDILGRLYEHGHNPQILLLYPKIAYPVSRGTPMIAPQIKWDHSSKWFCSKDTEPNLPIYSETSVAISFVFDDWKFVTDHIIDGKNLFPAAGYLYVVWEVLSKSLGRKLSETPVKFSNCQFTKATNITSNVVSFVIVIQRISGKFNILHDSIVTMSGEISVLEDNFNNFIVFPGLKDTKTLNKYCMNSEDVYKELQLRGYDYRNQFETIESRNVNGNKGYIKWTKNWVTFLDGMMQFSNLSFASRLLYVPTEIRNLIIHPKEHKNCMKSYAENSSLPVTLCKNNNIIRCGGVQLDGLVFTPIMKRKKKLLLVLEKLQFVPNTTKLTLLDSIRVNLQLALENNYDSQPKIVEIVNEADVSENYLFMAPLIRDSLENFPTIVPNITVYSKSQIDLPNLHVKNSYFDENATCFLIAGNLIFMRKEVLKLARNALKTQECYILSRENLDFLPNNTNTFGFNILTMHTIENKKIILAQPSFNLPSPTVIKISNEDDSFNWIENVKKSIKSHSNVILCAQNEVLNGLQGFINCLRKEPGCSRIRAVIINDDQVPAFDNNHSFYRKQLKKQLAINVYQNSKWGTYRSLLLKNDQEVSRQNCYVKLCSRGNLSTLQWVEGPFSLNNPPDTEKRLVHVYYSALNFKDIVIATGRLIPRSNMQFLNKRDVSVGIEFSGRDEKGMRVAGLVTGDGIATMVNADKHMLWNVPDNWTLEDAATVVSVYATVLYALIIKGKIKTGESILIHSGCSGVGLAAIKVALSFGCKVYTTVGTSEKRLFLKEKYPQLTDIHIGYSRDTSFKIFIKNVTHGRGVDLLLNCLSEDKFEASVTCLAPKGRFLEIGRVDLMNNSQLQLEFIRKEASFHGIALDKIFEGTSSEKKNLHKLLQDGITSGQVQPLYRNVFQKDEVQKAFRYMTQGTHIGKVLLQIRNDEFKGIVKPSVKTFLCLSRYTCNREKSYVIIGGLGGFGLELADWLVERGAKNLILNSRTGIKNGYQQYKISSWKRFGANTIISKADITNKSGCEQLIREATSLGEVDAIFNLAMILRDAVFENQTIENFRFSFGPKARATHFMDKLSRTMCPDLRDFVVFSSVSCGRGIPGQTNYGMSNSAMESICEQRKQAGFPATAIEWGPVGDVGILAKAQKEEKNFKLVGMWPQSIFSCLEVLDTLLTNKSSTIVSSIVLAEKQFKEEANKSIIDTILDILGFKKELIRGNLKLSEMGMDSLSAIEIKQAIEQYFHTYFTAEEIRNLDFNRLEKMQNTRTTHRGVEKTKNSLPIDLDLVYKELENGSRDHSDTIILSSSRMENKLGSPKIFCFPGLEGNSSVLEPLSKNLNAKVIGLQFSSDVTLINMVNKSVKIIQQEVNETELFHVLLYSWGSIPGFETVSILEDQDFKCIVHVINETPKILKELYRPILFDPEIEYKILKSALIKYIPEEMVAKKKEIIIQSDTFEKKLDLAEAIVKEFNSITGTTFNREFPTVIYNRIKTTQHYKPTYKKIKSSVYLYKTSEMPNSIEDGLSEICVNFKKDDSFDGGHASILHNNHLAEKINRHIHDNFV